VWIWFIATLVRDFLRAPPRRLPVAVERRLAVIGAMLAAGLFEYNFGDSEFLMMFLVLSRCPTRPTRARGRGCPRCPRH
jgi:hypothetical protein